MSRSGAVERMTRLLAMVPWIAANDGPTTTEICARFGISEAQLAEDLGVMWLVGLPPYTPDVLVDVITEGDRVWIRFPDVFEAPQRLTPTQALALMVAGASVLALPGAEADGPLRSGVRKLADLLGLDLEQALEVDLGEARPEVLAAVRQAITAGEQLDLVYYSHGRDARTERTVDPHRVVAHDGALYLLAWCHRAQDHRSFRLDRVEQATLAGTPAVVAPREGPVPVFIPAPEWPRVVLDLAPEARWVADRNPVEAIEDRPGGGLRVTLAVAERRWLERLLVTLGDRARVVRVEQGPPELADAGRAAASRILARYR
jgi:proteasome accessory factor C